MNQLEQELRSLLEKVQRRKLPAGALERAVISSDDVSTYNGDSYSGDALCVDIQQSQDTSRKLQRKINPFEGYSTLHIQSTKNSAKAQSSSRLESGAKQLTIYESWMSTAERNSNGENDKTQSTLKMERING
ncbi:starch synthase 3, chloroplastic/amyloplastic [Dorcoceras hygrometricum]|uniref:Starch synthase 3, chloroplastic/amyloplastic n=1 Tax=Dorcoceras hygrometricum TaxID=472368 RepID=A0A2Z7CWD5_9LAMI|nr:starch synthase 3, chloroplastic/amyloplastic [Dorcoceras hygrometricum]